MPDLGWNDVRVFGALALGMVGLVGFIVVEARSSHPMLPLHLFRSQTFAGANLLTLFLYGALSAFSFFLPLNLVQAQEYSQFFAGLAIIPFAVLLALLSRWAGEAVNKYGPRRLLIFGPGLAGLGFLILAFVGLTPGPEVYWRSYLPGILIIGLGMGLTVAPLSNTVMSALDTDYAGTASGVNNAISRTAGVLAIAVVGAIALIFFASSLSDRVATLDLSPTAQQALQREADRLGEASVPKDVAPEKETAVSEAIDQAFVDTFQVVMFICAGLAWFSAGMAGWLIEEEETYMS
jgi:MFS family permease